MEQAAKNIRIISLEPDDPRQVEATAQLIELDCRCFGDIDSDDEGDSEYWLKLRPACFTFLALEGDEIVGYLDLLSVNRAGVDLLSQGKLRDGQLADYVVARESSDRDVNLYVVAIVVEAEYRGVGVGGGLWDFARNYLSDNNLLANNILATVWTADGQRFFGKRSFHQVGQDGFGHSVLEINVNF